MTDQATLANEMGRATSEMLAAAETIKKIEPRLEKLEERVEALDGKAADAEKEGEEMHHQIEKLTKKTARISIAGEPQRMVPAEVKQFADWMSKGTPMDVKTVSEQTGSEGRHALPLSINKFVQDQLLEVNPMRQLASVVSVESPQFRHLVNVKGATCGWGEEIDVRNPTDTPQLEKIEPAMAENYAYAEITQWAARDLFDGKAEGWLTENIVEEFARSEGEKFINGTGNKEPYGLLQAPVSTDDDATRAFGTWKILNSGDAAGFAASNPADILVDMIYDLGSSYRRNGTWLMNSATAGTVRKFKDADGRFLWADSLIPNQPATLMGYPVAIVEEMPDVAAGNTPIAFGNIARSYIIADLQSIYTVRDEVTKPGWIKVYMFRRLAGHVTDTKAMRLLSIEA